mmetsp:Transcript_40484/g.71773  ORF Transcript_40484/g.71773 Transcript_40484/m.71773 type:complete len:235 (+) Transcript_40484:261-965(+)
MLMRDSRAWHWEEEFTTWKLSSISSENGNSSMSGCSAALGFGSLQGTRWCSCRPLPGPLAGGGADGSVSGRAGGVYDSVSMTGGRLPTSEFTEAADAAPVLWTEGLAARSSAAVAAARFSAACSSMFRAISSLAAKLIPASGPPYMENVDFKRVELLLESLRRPLLPEAVGPMTLLFRWPTIPKSVALLGWRETPLARSVGLDPGESSCDSTTQRVKFTDCFSGCSAACRRTSI